jgi:hypothetical protein
MASINKCGGPSSVGDGHSISTENFIVNDGVVSFEGNHIASAHVGASHHGDISRSLAARTGRRFLLFCYFIIFSSPVAYMQIKIDLH